MAAEYDGLYISHLRSEGDRLLEGVDELIRISREAGIRAEIYHLKAGGEANWPKLDELTVKTITTRPRLITEIQLMTFGAQLLNKLTYTIWSIGQLTPVSHFSSAFTISNSH